MACTEALRLTVSADTRGAVSSIERLGKTADRELGRSTKRLDVWANRLSSGGAPVSCYVWLALNSRSGPSESPISRSRATTSMPSRSGASSGRSRSGTQPAMARNAT